MKTILSFIMISFLNTNCGQISKQINFEIKKIEIKYVDFSTTTDSRISCNEFEMAFKNNIRSIIITDSKKLSTFGKLLTRLTGDTKGKNQPDTRAKIIISRFYTKSDTICVNNYAISYDGKLMLRDDEFINYVKSIIQ